MLIYDQLIKIWVSIAFVLYENTNHLIKLVFLYHSYFKTLNLLFKRKKKKKKTTLKQFDSVRIFRLCLNLNSMGIRNKISVWCKSFLSYCWGFYIRLAVSHKA